MKRDPIHLATVKLQHEMQEQLRRKYASFGIALANEWGWKKVRIDRLFDEVDKALDECSQSNQISILQMLEDETGIECRLAENGKSYHEYNFLDCKASPIDQYKMNRAQWLYLRSSQIKWTGTMILATFFLALHRKEGFGAGRIQRILEQISAIEAEYPNTQKLVTACSDITGINIEEEWKKK